MSGTPSRKRTRPVCEIEFSLDDVSYPFVGASEREACTFELAEIIPRDDGTHAEFFNVVGSDAERILELAAANERVKATLLGEYGDSDLYEFLVSDECPAARLAELGALPRTVRGVEGEGRIVVEIAPQYDAAAIVEAFLDEYPDIEIVSKREKTEIAPLLRKPALREVLRTRLTDRQREVLEAAFESGYYEWPRECTGEDVADELGISSSTFSEHIHAAERNLFTVMFEESRHSVDH
jgi:predicted DNA binding protein